MHTDYGFTHYFENEVLRKRLDLMDMRLSYYQDTDSLYIDLSGKTSATSVEIAEGIIIDYDAQGEMVGIDIDNASKKADLTELILNKLPIQKHRITS